MEKVIKSFVFEKRFFRKDNEVCEHIKFGSGVETLRLTTFQKGLERYDNINVPKNFFESWNEIDIKLFTYLLEQKIWKD